MFVKWFARSLVFVVSFLCLVVPLTLSQHDYLAAKSIGTASTTTTPHANSPRDQSGSTRAQSAIHAKQVRVESSIPMKMPSPKLVDKEPTPPMVGLGATGPSAEWLNEALAVLGYLPVRFVGDDGESSASMRADLDASLASGVLTPLSGTWQWTFKSPQSLASLWNPAAANRITQGAVMSFEAANHLEVDGIAGPQVYGALRSALADGAVSHQVYTYVTVTKSSPEELQVWQNGKVVLTSLANTGIAASPTPNGTWPVYERLVSQDMQGTNPDGTHYNDPGVPYVSYFYEGCAIHGFERASYGSPQSLGCVELPVQEAAKVYSLLQYGTLVTVQP